MRASGTLSILAIISERNEGAGQQRENQVIEKARKIRDAAALMAAKNFHGDFELTDQHGRSVPLPPQERGNLCSALALHTLGKRVLSDSTMLADSSSQKGSHAVEAGPEEKRASTETKFDSIPAAISVACAAGTKETKAEDTAQKQLADALAVLLEADASWSGVSEAWQRQVDNYGLLQLDIAWCLLKLVSDTPARHVRVRHLHLGASVSQVLGALQQPQHTKLHLTCLQHFAAQDANQLVDLMTRIACLCVRDFGCLGCLACLLVGRST